jgi:hypothetical protein
MMQRPEGSDAGRSKEPDAWKAISVLPLSGSEVRTMNDSSIINPRHMTTRDLALFGVQDLAFIKAVSVNDEVGYAIHAADGTQMALVTDRDVAFAAVRQHGLEPVSVH